MPTVFNGVYITRHCWINYGCLSVKTDHNVIVIQTLIAKDVIFNYGGFSYTNCKFDEKAMFLNGNDVIRLLTIIF